MAKTFAEKNRASTAAATHANLLADRPDPDPDELEIPRFMNIVWANKKTPVGIVVASARRGCDWSPKPHGQRAVAQRYHLISVMRITASSR